MEQENKNQLSREQLEIAKLQYEIKQLKKPIFLRTDFLSIVASAMVAAITIYFTVARSKSDDLKQATADKIIAQNESISLRTLAVSQREDDLKKSIKKLEIKQTNLKDSVNIKFQRDLLVFENKFKDLKLDINDYRQGYAKGRVKRESEYGTNINRFVIPQLKDEFNMWYKNELIRAMTKSNDYIINQIELERKLLDYRPK